MTQTDAYHFAAWMLCDVAYRRDHTGDDDLKRSTRRSATLNGSRRPFLIYSARVFDLTAPNETCGLCWQGTIRGRGNDLGWRVTLAATALQRTGILQSKACAIIAAFPAVMQHFGNQAATIELVEKIRSTVNNYRTTWGPQIDIGTDLQAMLGIWRWIHGAEKGEEYYQEAREEYYKRIDNALGAFEMDDWQRVEPLLAWAATAHEWGKHGEAANWYRQAYDEIVAMKIPVERKDVHLSHIQAQIQRCETRQGPDEGLRPMLYEGELMSLKEAVKRAEAGHK